MSDRTFDYSSTQINIDGRLKKEILNFHNKVKKDNLYTDEPGYGFEDEPHVTVLYGLHTKSPKGIEEAIKDEKPVKIKLGKVSRFENKDKPYDVIKVEVISDDLKRLHDTIADSEEYTSDFKNYNPHITIAYVKKGKHKELVGNKTFSGKTFVGTSVIFSSSNGKKTSIHLKSNPNSVLYKKGFIDRLNELGVPYEKNIQAQSFLHGRVSELLETREAGQ